MIEYKVCEVLDGKMEDYIQQYQNAMNDGAATDYAQYKEMCGVIKGLKTAKMEIKELSKSMRDADDE